MSIFSSENARANEEIESFGPRWDSPDVYNNHGAASLTGIPSGSSANACFKPLLGLFSQSKIYPFGVVSSYT